MSEDERRTGKEALQQLRQQRKASIERSREIIKARNRDIKIIREQLKESAKTVPEIAAATRMPSSQVLLYISGLRKYGLVREDEKAGDYFKYALAG